MPFVPVPGGEIYWKLEGSDNNPPLILLNSIGTDMDLWDPTLPALRKGFAVLRIDTRGHGASRHSGGDVSLNTLAQDVLAVADAARMPWFALAGVSLGGMIAMELAANWPERVSSAALICTSAKMDAAMWADRVRAVRGEGMEAVADGVMQRFLSEEFRRANPAVAASLRRQLLSMDKEGYAACGAAIRDMDLVNRISRISCPTLVVSGSHDTSTPRDPHGAFLMSAIPGAVGTELPASHLAPVDCADELAKVLIDFTL